jgi:predicted phosphodiesterase
MSPNTDLEARKPRGINVIVIRFLILLICFVLTIILGIWLKAVPRQRNGSQYIQVPEKETVHLFFLGDTGTGDDIQMQVAVAMEKRCQALGGIDGIVLLGDLFYMGGVQSADDPQWTTKIEKPYGLPCLSRANIYPVLGNHDYKGNPGALIEYGRKNPRWQMPYRFYRVDFGTLFRLVAIDSSVSDFCFIPTVCSMDFLLDSLDASPTTWTTVAAHHPLASASVKGYSHSGGILGFLVKPLVCDKADVWFSGHAHHQEHRQDDGCNTDLVISGGGGGELNEIRAGEAETKFGQSVHGFAELTIQKDQLVVDFRDAEANSIYSFSRKKH